MGVVSVWVCDASVVTGKWTTTGGISWTLCVSGVLVCGCVQGLESGLRLCDETREV